MLTLSKALTSAQAKVYYQKDFSNGAGNYYSQQQTVVTQPKGQPAFRSRGDVMTPTQFLPTTSVPALGLGWTSGLGWFARAPVLPMRLDGYPPVCQSALPTPVPVALAQGSRQQNSLSFPLQSSAPPVTTAP
jgi:hypothetical protein